MQMQEIKKPEKKSKHEMASAPMDFYRPTVHLDSEQVDLPDVTPGETITLQIKAKVTGFNSSTNTDGESRKSITFEIHEIGFDKTAKATVEDEDDRPMAKAFKKAKGETAASEPNELEDM